MKLIFDDKLFFEGRSFGYDKNVQGEVVFNTGMTGYVENLTDPSYRGQILVMTYPLQGNYGVPDRFWESEKIQVQGLIVSTYTEQPNHFSLVHTLGDWLKKQEIPGLCGVDTRTLTRYLREFGTKPGKLYSDESLPEPEDINIEKILDLVGQLPSTWYGTEETKILIIDTGEKENIVRYLGLRGVSVIRIPWNASWESYLDEVDGVFLPNGPGDPTKAHDLVHRIQNILTLDIPIFGICFGNQLLGLAAGGEIQKMKYGHRSANQPVRDLVTNRCYITSQNHGYVLNNESISNQEWEPWFLNLNDGTNEGIRHKTKNIRAVQFHPEACPGPNDTAFLLDEFIKTVKENKKCKKPSFLVSKIEKQIPRLAEKV